MSSERIHCLERTMGHYLVSAIPKADRLDELRERLMNDEFREMRPFGRALTRSLREARRREDRSAVWEEEDYCRPPLAEERAAVLDAYFDHLTIERVQQGAGWRQIDDLPRLFSERSFGRADSPAIRLANLR